MDSNMETNIETNIETNQETAGMTNTARPDPAEPLLSQFGIFGVASIVYGMFFTFCLYKNYAGITLPFLAAATCAYYGYCMKKLGKTFRRDSYFYGAGILLLGIATVFTDSGLFIFFNYVGMILLLVTCLILNFYKNTNFRFGRYLGAILWILFGSIGYLAYPFRSFGIFLRKSSKKEGKGKYVWFGLLIAIPLLFIVMSLLMSADAVFRNLFDELFQKIVIPANVLGIGFMLCLGTLGSYLIVANLVSGLNDVPDTKKPSHEPVIAITFTSVLTAVYLLFCFIQIFYLFLGNLKLPEGYTYATYAREGFFQLLFVCIINLIIVLICVEQFREHAILKAVLSVFCACTFIMIASSAMRMILYIKVYFLSLERVLVLWALLVITILMALVCISIYKREFPLFRYGVMVVSICYVLLSLSRPDTYIARYNIVASHMSEGRGTLLDYDYLFYDLSADAAPVLDAYGLLKPVRGSVQKGKLRVNFNLPGDSSDTGSDLDARDYYYYYWDLSDKSEEMGIRSFNVSRYLGKKIARKYNGVINFTLDE